MSEVWSVERMVGWLAADFTRLGLDSPRLDAELIVADALGCARMQLYLELERPLTDDERAAVKARLVRRRAREPMAYILGRRGFYKHDFVVNPHVLIPRPDSETLVEAALSAIDERPGETLRVADVCTGSGCVGLSIALAREGVSVALTDLSAEALEVAAINAERLEATVDIRRGDLFAPLKGEMFDIITLNPPYLAERELAQTAPEIFEYEPKAALVAGPNGDEFLKRIASDVRALLAPGGVLLVELGIGQSSGFCDELASHGFGRRRVHRDFGGIERVVEGRVETVRDEELTSAESHLDLDSSERALRELDD